MKNFQNPTHYIKYLTQIVELLVLINYIHNIYIYIYREREREREREKITELHLIYLEIALLNKRRSKKHGGFE